MEKLIEALRHISRSKAETLTDSRETAFGHLDMATDLIKDFLKEEGGYNVHTQG